MSPSDSYMAFKRCFRVNPGVPFTILQVHADEPHHQVWQYVSKRHKESLKEFKRWRKREDVQEGMRAMKLLEPSKQLEVYDYL